MSVNLYRSDGTTPLDGLAITNEQAGADSDTITFKVKNDGATDAVNVLLVQRVVDPADATELLSTGAPPNDEMWGRVRITAFDNSAEPTWSVNTTAWLPIGAFAGLLIGTIPPDCIVTCEYKSHPPSSAESGPWVRSLVPIYNEFSQPIPSGVSRENRGIYHGVGDFAHYGLIDGLGVTVSGSPDDEVHSAAGRWVHAGRLYGDVPRDYTLNQNDSAASALTAGQHYWAVISAGAGVLTATKGVRGTSPAKPPMPTGDIFIRYVKVDFQAGASVIETADLDGTTVYDRYLAVAGSGLNLTIHAGQAQGGSTWRYAQGTQTLPLTDATTNYVWQLASGLFEDTTTTVAPEATAIGPLWEVVTAAGAITTITDRRYYMGQTVTIKLRAVFPGSAGELISELIEHERLFLEQVVYRISDNGGTSGQTKLDVTKGGTTIYTDFAVSDQRPTFAHDTVTLTNTTSVHQVTELRKGDVVALISLEHPTGGSGAPVWGEAYLICRKP